jgi:hypothetical protein
VPRHLRDGRRGHRRPRLLSSAGQSLTRTARGACGVGRSPDASVTDPPRCDNRTARPLSAKREQDCFFWAIRPHVCRDRALHRESPRSSTPRSAPRAGNRGARALGDRRVEVAVGQLSHHLKMAAVRIFDCNYVLLASLYSRPLSHINQFTNLVTVKRGNYTRVGDNG